MGIQGGTDSAQCSLQALLERSLTHHSAEIPRRRTRAGWRAKVRWRAHHIPCESDSPAPRRRVLRMWLAGSGGTGWQADLVRLAECLWLPDIRPASNISTERQPPTANRQPHAPGCRGCAALARTRGFRRNGSQLTVHAPHKRQNPPCTGGQAGAVTGLCAQAAPASVQTREASSF